MFSLLKLVLQKDALESLRVQLEKAVQKEKQYLQTMVSKEAYEELSRKSVACQNDLTQTLEKVSHTLSSPGLFGQRNVRVAWKVRESIPCATGCHQDLCKLLPELGCPSKEGLPPCSEASFGERKGAQRTRPNLTSVSAHR